MKLYASGSTHILHSATFAAKDTFTSELAAARLLRCMSTASDNSAHVPKDPKLDSRHVCSIKPQTKLQSYSLLHYESLVATQGIMSLNDMNLNMDPPRLPWAGQKVTKGICVAYQLPAHLLPT